MQDRLGQLALGRFRLTGLIGMGGQGMVYTGTDEQTGRPVAVKLARPEKDDVGQDRRARLEADLLGRIDSPYLAKLVACGSDEGLGSFCVVEELVPGRTVSYLLGREGPFAAAEIAVVVSQAAQGLSALHGAGYILRDLSPGQVMLHRTPASGVQVKLIDLGFVRRIGEETGVTDPRYLAGTPGFTAPELARGMPATPASDVYSLAALTYQMAAGAPAFPLLAAEGIVALQLADAVMPLPPCPRLGACRDALWAVLADALSSNPADRPSTPEHLARLVEQALSAAAGPPSSRRLLLWLAAAAMLIAAGVLLL